MTPEPAPITACRPIMIQGTASASGKSLMATALCRIFLQDGYRVAPFKAQNMSNNSFVTRNGLEMGRAQAVQAFASGLEPEIRMNPVLLKPSSENGSQAVVKGRPAFNIGAVDWREARENLRPVIRECYESLAGDFDIIVIEGAGSPAEINLKQGDLVNMGMAKMADAPVIIVGDIDRGGVFASLAGTMLLLEGNERARVKGFIINKFRGDVSQLKSGLEKLTEITGVPVLGVVPWLVHDIDDEDAVADRLGKGTGDLSGADICIIRLPHLSNFTDFIPLEVLPGAAVRWCDRAEEIGSPDLLIIPGTKATISDLQTLKQSGMADALLSYARGGGTILGICGGFQMLGRTISDPGGIESASGTEAGLGLLDMATIFTPEKETSQTGAIIQSGCSPLFNGLNGTAVLGYEIHMGKSEYGPESVPFTRSSDISGSERVNGIMDPSGRILGTYLHGFFDSAPVVSVIVNTLRKEKGLAELDHEAVDRVIALSRDIEKLAETVRRSLDMDAIYRLF